LKAQKPSEELATLLRELVRPLHDFDKRWRSVVPDLLEEEEDREEKEAPPEKRDGLIDREETMLLESYERWEAIESKRLEEEKAKKKAKGKEKARDQDRMDGDETEEQARDEGDDEVSTEKWLSEREVYE
jgi:hypothetical protein